MKAYRSGVKVPRTARAAFTLLEMLVVVLIIGVLASLTLFVINAASAHNARATTVQNIEKVRAALEEYYALYGQYPPVASSLQSSSHSFAYQVPTNQSINPPVFSFGLCGYLVLRASTASNLTYHAPITGLYNAPTWVANNPNSSGGGYPGDSLRDQAAVNRWSPMLDGVVQTHENGAAGLKLTVLDGWGYDLYYWSPPPYQTYDIWSAGPDHASGGPLSGITDPKAAADDIHSSPGR